MPSNDREPPREVLAPEVEYAARVIHREVWGSPYRKGEGPMHFAGGSYWSTELRRRAARWEYLAEAARTCADALPGERWGLVVEEPGTGSQSVPDFSKKVS